jgi:RNA polymerase sigma-70 factor (ECF subfamily)
MTSSNERQRKPLSGAPKSSVQEDLQLLQAWRDGQKDAGDELLNRHFDSIARFFRRKLGDDVQDLIQQTFLDCIEGKDRIEQGNFRAYLYGIARNRLSLWLRQKSRHGTVVDLSVNSVADCQTRPSKRIARGQEEAVLLEAMRHIPIDQQIALELNYWEGMSGPEVAAVLGVPANTIRGRLSRARQALRDQLDELERQ